MDSVIDINKSVVIDINKYGSLEVAEKNGVRHKLISSLPAIDDEYLKSIRDRKSKYYLSEWKDNIITIDTSKNRSSNDLLVINLNDILIQCSGPMSVFNGVLPITTFSNLKDTCKAYLNKCAITFGDSTKCISDIMQNFNNVLRFMTWMIQKKGVYRISALTRDDFKEFIDQYCIHHGWYRLLNYDAALAKLLQEVRAGSVNLNDISSHYYSCNFNLKYDMIAKITGVVIPDSFTPAWFKKELIALSGLKIKRESLGKYNPDRPPSYMSIYSVIKSLNRLYGLPDRFDQVSALPYPNGHRVATDLAKVCNSQLQTVIAGKDGRTANLRLEDAISLFRLSVDWVYDYSDGIIEVLNLYRKRYESKIEFYKNGGRIRGKFRISNKQKLDPEFHKFDTQIRTVCKLHNLPFETVVPNKQNFTYDSESAPNLDSIIKMLMSACFVMVAINHGRRLNEIIGQGGLTYGLYFGCIREKEVPDNIAFIDIYIEKTIRDWCSFYVNNLVKDVVKVLEEVSQAFRPLGMERKIYSNDNKIARKDKLFRIKTTSHTNWFDDTYASFLFSLHSKQFFKKAGVTIENIDHRGHPFRRLFALLYYYRYDNASLLALQHHMRHLDPGMTVVYLTDPRARREADRIENIYKDKVKQHTNDEMGSLDDVRSESFSSAVLEILKGERSGGRWPVIVLSMYKVLSRRGVFTGLDLDGRAQLTADKLLKRGYDRVGYIHGGCNNGTNLKTRRMSRCHREEDDVRHTEDASAVKCQRCIHHDTGDTNIVILEEMANRLRVQTKDFKLPIHVRRATKKELSILLDMINSEKNLGEQNKKMIYSVVGTIGEELKALS